MAMRWAAHPQRDVPVGAGRNRRQLQIALGGETTTASVRLAVL